MRGCNDINTDPITWPPVAGAISYVLQRREGAVWTHLASNLTSPGFVDTTVLANRTYAYRVYALGDGTESDYSNSDVATTRTFIAAVPGPINAAPVNSMLDAVNSVRAAAGWTALNWGNILTSVDPLPAPGAMVLARHLTSCRARMNEALQALGAPVSSYATPAVSGQVIAAEHINEVQRRAQ